MTEKEDTSLEIYAHDLACLSLTNKPMGTQRHTYSLVVYLCNFLLFLFEHDIFALKLLENICT